MVEAKDFSEAVIVGHADITKPDIVAFTEETGLVKVGFVFTIEPVDENDCVTNFFYQPLFFMHSRGEQLKTTFKVGTS